MVITAVEAEDDRLIMADTGWFLTVVLVLVLVVCLEFINYICRQI